MSATMTSIDHPFPLFRSLISLTHGHALFNASQQRIERDKAALEAKLAKKAAQKAGQGK